MTVMLYKKDGAHLLHGHMVDWKTVEDDEVKAALAEGWARSPAEAYKPKKKPVKRKSK